MCFIFDHIYSACYIVQKKIFGRFAREIWGSIVLRATLSIITILMMVLLYRFTSNLFLVIIFPVLMCFGPLIHYYTKNRDKDLDVLLINFKKSPSFIQYLFVGYVLLFFVVLPIVAIMLVTLNISGYL